MGYIYSDSTSEIRIGRIDERGNVYKGTDSFTSSEKLVGRVADGGDIYNGFDSFTASEHRIGRVDEKGNIYKGIDTFSTSEVYAGRVDTNGSVFRGSDTFTTSESYVGRVDVDGRTFYAGAALLLLILSDVSENESKVVTQGTGGGIGLPPVQPNTPMGPGFGFGLGLGILALAVPVLMLFLGVYLPYDIVFGNDSLGFAEYSQLFLIVYGLSAVMIILSLITQIKTGESQLAVIYIYGFSALILMVGAFREGHPFLAILSIFPALILFAFPAIIWGLITFITGLFVKLAKKKGRGPSSSEKVDKLLGTIFNVVGIVLLIVSGVIGYMIAEV
ncbi:MAG: hypothetical protein J5537_00205 [Lachnospiraceae bacterium]|nr:hypothetical protein [Lachnospiraceae bacterium]